MTIVLLPERIQEQAIHLQVLQLRPEIIIHDLVTGKALQPIRTVAEKLQHLQAGSVQIQVLLIIEVLPKQVDLNNSEQMHKLCVPKGHILYRQNLTDLHLLHMKDMQNLQDMFIIQADNTEAIM
jgi:hypothetical protein